MTDLGAITVWLQCPSCRRGFTLEPIAGAGVEAAILHCACGDYPLIDGVPRLLDDALRRPILAQLRAGDADTALTLALEWPSFQLGRKVVRKVSRLLAASSRPVLVSAAAATRRHTVAALRDRGLDFCSMVDKIDQGLWGDWIKYRFSMTPLRPVYTLRAALRPGVPTLDVGAGFGHCAYLLAQALGARNIFCLDSTFSYLWLLRTRLVPDARVVCADASRGLPFADGAFPQAVSCDAFHFITNKAQLATELLRVTGPGGTVILSHIANRLVRERFDGEPLDPAGYRALFSDRECRIYPDESLVAPWRAGAPLDLSLRFADTQLAAVHAISLVASGIDGLFGTHEIGPLAQASPAHRINPRLELHALADEVVLVPRRVSPAFASLRADQFPVQGTHIPGARITADELILPDSATLAQSLADFLVLDLPAGYARTPGVRVQGLPG